MESSWLIEDRLGPAAEAAFLRSVTSGELTRVELSDADWGRVVELVETYADLGPGLVDASVIAVAERLGTTTIATLKPPRLHRGAPPPLPGLRTHSLTAGRRPRTPGPQFLLSPLTAAGAATLETSTTVTTDRRRTASCPKHASAPRRFCRPPSSGPFRPLHPGHGGLSGHGCDRSTVGRVVDPETGLIYLQHRYYDPATAQFLSRDPLDAQTRSAYGYVAGNPLNGADPTGLDWGWNPIDDVKQAANDVWHPIRFVATPPATAVGLGVGAASGGDCNWNGKNWVFVCSNSWSLPGSDAFTLGSMINTTKNASDFASENNWFPDRLRVGHRSG